MALFMFCIQNRITLFRVIYLLNKSVIHYFENTKYNYIPLYKIILTCNNEYFISILIYNSP